MIEVFSPARVAKVCAKFGLVPGTSIDLTIGWHFDLGSHRRKAVEEIRTDKPLVVIGSPPCTEFSQLQTLNAATQSAEWLQNYELRRQQAVRHVEV